MIVRYEPDVTRVVRSYFSSRMPDYSLVGFHDLLQAGMLCVCRYVDRYDSEYGTTFMEYLNSSVNSKLIGHMIDCLRSMQDYPRVIASNRRLMRPLLHALRHELGKEPTIEEIIDRYGESFRPIVSDPLFFTGVYNQAQETGRQEDDYQIEFEDKSDQQPTVTHKMDAMSRILNVIKDDRIRQVVFAYYYVGKNHCMIAESEGISVSTASNLRREGLRIISSNFSEEELNELSRMARRHGS